MRSFLGRLAAKGCAVVALVALFSAPWEAQAQQPTEPGTSFVILVKGIYQPVVEVPALDLTTVKVSGPGYLRTQIYRVSGLPGPADQPLGTFYVNPNPDVLRCAYQLPGGAIAAAFTKVVGADVTVGGQHFWVGSAELAILEATGIYRSFVGGKIHMESKVHYIDAATWDEYCICFISR